MIGKPLNIAQLGNELSIFIEDSIASGQISLVIIISKITFFNKIL